MTLSHRTGFLLGALALACSFILPTVAAAQDPPAQVEIVNPVVPVQYEPLRPYQKSVSLTGDFDHPDLVAEFGVPAGFYLIVDHLFVTISLKTNQPILLRSFSSFQGEPTELGLAPVLTPKYSNTNQRYVLDEPVTLYTDSTLQIHAHRSPGTPGPWGLKATVVGHLVAVGR